MTSIFVIVPAFNEGTVIHNTLMQLLHSGHQVVVVDDGSTDNTWEVVKELPVHVIRHALNLGQGAALQTGIDFSLTEGADYFVTFDADGQHCAQDIEALLSPLITGKADIALGSRFLRPEDRQTVPTARRILLQVARGFNLLLTNMWLSDAHNGLRAFNRKTASCIRLRKNRYAHATEILFQIRQHHLTYVEVPTHVAYTTYSRQKGQSVWNAVNIVIDILLGRFFK